MCAGSGPLVMYICLVQCVAILFSISSPVKMYFRILQEHFKRCFHMPFPFFYSPLSLSSASLLASLLLLLMFFPSSTLPSLLPTPPPQPLAPPSSVLGSRSSRKFSHDPSNRIRSSHVTTVTRMLKPLSCVGFMP